MSIISVIYVTYFTNYNFIVTHFSTGCSHASLKTSVQCHERSVKLSTRWCPTSIYWGSHNRSSQAALEYVPSSFSSTKHGCIRILRSTFHKHFVWKQIQRQANNLEEKLSEITMFFVLRVNPGNDFILCTGVWFHFQICENLLLLGCCGERIINLRRQRWNLSFIVHVRRHLVALGYMNGN